MRVLTEENDYGIRHMRIDGARIIQVIQVESVIGEGTDEDPVRTEYQYYSLDGKLLAVHDTLWDTAEMSLPC